LVLIELQFTEAGWPAAAIAQNHRAGCYRWPSLQRQQQPEENLE
jgi:hypothetical protein